MNKIIILGNGFDKAHGLKTSYKDFIEDYLRNFFLKAVDNNGNFKDDNYSVKLHVTRDYQTMSLEHLIVNLAKLNSEGLLIVKNDFFNKIIMSSSNNWVDIEDRFFQNLMEYQRRGIPRNPREEFTLLDKEIDKLNSEFSLVQKLLTDYLNTKVVPEIEKAELPFEDYFINNCAIDKYSKTLIVNFNYTSTINKYSEIL